MGKKKGWKRTEPEATLWNILPNIMVHMLKNFIDVFTFDNLKLEISNNVSVEWLF